MTLRLTRLEFERLQRREKGNKRNILMPQAGRRWEIEMAAQLDAAGLAGRYVREHRFQPDRRFRFDFAFLPEQFAIEVDGAVHRIKKRFHGDREKGQLALLGGWRVLHVSPDQVRSGAALALVIAVLTGALPGVHPKAVDGGEVQA